MTQLDYDLDNYLNELDNEFECYECGTSISKEGYCSRIVIKLDKNDFASRCR
jgi:hypothetical protein